MLAVLRGAVNVMGVQGALAAMHVQRCAIYSSITTKDPSIDKVS